MGEIVITAQRKTESLQKAGIAVDVITSAVLVKHDVSNAANISSVVPALNVQAGGGANTIFFLRGVGNFTVNGYSDPAIAFNYDDVYLGRPTSTSGMFYDLERLEVLKGPQGTLYGRNATAGAINVLPARPKLHQESGQLVASLGNFGAVNMQGAVNLPIGNTMALRVAGNYVKHDGYLSDGQSDEDTAAARVQWLYRPSSDFSIRLNADYSKTGGVGPGSSYGGHYALNFQTGKYGFVPSGIDNAVGLLSPEAQAYRQTLFAGLSGRTLNPLDDNVYQKNDFKGISAHVEWTTGAGTLTIIPAARESNLDNRFAVPGFIGLIDEKDKQTSLEARFNGKRIGKLDYILGAYYFNETVSGHYNFSQQALSAYQDLVSKTESYAVFARTTLNLTDRFRAVGGVRYTNDKKTFDGQADVFLVRCLVRNGFGVPSCPLVPLLPVTYGFNELPAPFIIPPENQARPIGATGGLLIRASTPVHAQQKNDKITYRLGVEYDIAPRSLFYASFETGYRSGGFSLSAGHEQYLPEFIDAYTVGSKNRLFGNKLQLNLEGFIWKYRDQQVNHTGLDANGNQGVFTENLGRSTNKGIEIDARYLPATHTLLSASVQYLDATYEDFTFTQPNAGLPPVVGCPYTVDPANPAQFLIDCSGKQTYQSPKWTLNLGAQQTFPMGEHEVVASVDTQYKSERFVGFEYLDSEIVPANWVSNLQISYGDSDRTWSVNAWVRNLEDKRIVTSTQFYASVNAIQNVTTPPRTYGFRFNREF
ncbi:tonB dependent receptor family protein [Asticcacaulis biprosthecium C19]|uniref:TonB dependent receptor family protein n=1 Tax=Asticcacaulis biprosthecium C19 TaxID=715226 RepID=F4QT91_9CAUL|nr:TonB-dependent receptor [Asticcacaulis biprosthecium]EGF89961.1 tonB dependent receptor family protein [Asticcacaulis biprosthecium C19]